MPSQKRSGCLIEHFGNADAVPQLPERCLSRQAGIVRYCLKYLSLIHISEPTRLGMISYAVFCLKKKKKKNKKYINSK